MERRLNAALSNALDAEISNQLKGDLRPSDLMPQEISANAPKAGRRKSIAQPDDTSDTDSQPGGNQRGGGALSSRSCGNNPTASESELMSSLVRRLTEAEREVKILKADVGHKHATIEDLKRKNRVLKDQVMKAPSPLVVKRMETENRKLTNTVREMEKFLADYGLTWVGETDPACSSETAALPAEDPSASPSEEWVPGASVASPTSPVTSPPKENDPSIFEFDMKVLQARLAELNVVAGEGTCDVQKNKQGEFKLMKRDPIELNFWKNGFQMDGAPLRSYTVPMNRAFVQDILDGYFPYELKEKYPDGIPFTVIDSTFEKHHRPFSQAGRGRQLSKDNGGKVGQSIADVSAPDAKTKAKEEEHGDADKFLAKLPKNVIRNGKIIPVRAGVEDMVKPAQDKNEVKVVHIDAVEDDSAGRGEGVKEKIATLQVKSTDMQRTFVMRFPYSTTIAQVLCQLGKQGEIPAQCDKDDGVLPQYHLQTTFPKKTLDDTSVTLESAGLVPNCALVLVKSCS